MASSGRVESGILKHSKFYVSWQVAETSIAENYHTINWQVGLNCGTSSNWDAWYNNAIKINSLSINGTTVISGNSYSNISGAGDHQIASGTIKIYHNADGTKEFNVNLSGWLYDYGNTNANQNFTLDSIPRQAAITSAPDFNDEQNPTINYSNPAGNSVSSLKACISFDGSKDDIKYRDISKTGSSYTFNLTEAERNVLRNGCVTSNSRTIIFYVTTAIGSNTFYSRSYKKLTIVNGNPIIGNFTYKDNNSTTVNITGNNQRIIRNNSNLLFTIGNATFKKGATLSKYQISISGTTKEKNSSGDIDWGKLNFSSNVTATLKVIDSRGNSATKNITIVVDNWELPTGIVSVQRKNNFYSETYLKVDGNCSSLNNKNVLSIKYRYKKATDSSYSSDKALSDNVQTTLNLDNNYQWNIQIVVSDKIGQTTYNAFVDRGMPIAFFDKLKESVGIGCFPKFKNGLESTLLNLHNSPVNFGACREITSENSYVKLFTLTMTANYKSCNILFAVGDTQATTGYALCNLQLYKGSGDVIAVNEFSRIDIRKSYTDRLVAVSTGDYKIEVYEKMAPYDSPTVNVISMLRLRQEDAYGKIDIDCNTVVSSLPANPKKWSVDNFKNETVLYDNASGNNGTVTLSENINNYEYLRIEYGYGYSKTYKGSIMTPVTSGAVNIVAGINNQTVSTSYLAISNLSMADKTLTPIYWGEYASVQQVYNTENLIYVLKVVGIGGK